MNDVAVDLESDLGIPPTPSLPTLGSHFRFASETKSCACYRGKFESCENARSIGFRASRRPIREIRKRAEKRGGKARVLSLSFPDGFAMASVNVDY